MARTYGRILSDVWDDPDQADFRALSSDAKVLYWAFCSQRDITPAGVVPLTERRWQGWLNVDREAVETAFDELVEGRFVAVDEATAEVWVRTFVSADGRLDNANLAKSVHSSITEIRSAAIREACYRLVGDLTGQTPSMNALPRASKGPPDDVGKGSRRDVEGTSNSSSQQPAAANQEPAASSREPRPTVDDTATPSPDLPAAAAAAIGLLIEHRVANEAKRNPAGLRRSLQRNLPDELGPALQAHLAKHPDATAHHLARVVLGLTELDLHRLSA